MVNCLEGDVHHLCWDVIGFFSLFPVKILKFCVLGLIGSMCRVPNRSP